MVLLTASEILNSSSLSVWCGEKLLPLSCAKPLRRHIASSDTMYDTCPGTSVVWGIRLVYLSWLGLFLHNLYPVRGDAPRHTSIRSWGVSPFQCLVDSLNALLHTSNNKIKRSDKVRQLLGVDDEGNSLQLVWSKAPGPAPTWRGCTCGILLFNDALKKRCKLPVCSLARISSKTERGFSGWLWSRTKDLSRLADFIDHITVKSTRV